jgi:3-deoxy-D-manno-octulosonic-acid transferase
MRLLYTVLYALGFVLLSPAFLYKMWKRGKYKENFFQRFGRYDPELRQRLANKTRPRCWIQAVSVGEVTLALLLIKHLPRFEIVLSTTTSTGYALAKQHLPANVALLYFPQDFPPCVRRAYDLIAPDCVVLVESEIWPNHIWQGARRQVQLFLINAALGAPASQSPMALPTCLRQTHAGLRPKSRRCHQLPRARRPASRTDRQSQVRRFLASSRPADRRSRTSTARAWCGCIASDSRCW